LEYLTTGDQWDFHFLRRKAGKDSSGEDKISGYELFELRDAQYSSDDGVIKVMGIITSEGISTKL
jgi:hypothetical protein